MENKINTHYHWHWISVSATKHVTRGDKVALCRKLEQRFGEGNRFEPDNNSSGFIKWIYHTTFFRAALSFIRESNLSSEHCL
jgi:hypothetical protein